MKKSWLENMDKPVVELFPASQFSWKATCPNCGPVEVVSKFKPKTCTNVLRYGKRSLRLCRRELTICQP